MPKLSWGVLGTGSIAKSFAKAIGRSKSGILKAVASRSQASADQFGNEFKVSKRYPNYQALLDDKSVQAVYISNPHPFHAEWAIKAAEAGKHILCEKTLTMNYRQAMSVVQAAQSNKGFL